MIESAVLWLLKVLAAPAVGLSSVFIIAFISATLVPLGSEPAVFAVVKANPAMFWPAILVATCGILMLGSKAEEYYFNIFFRIKMLLLALVFVHGWAFRRSVYYNTVEIDRAPRIPAQAKLAAFLSLLLWVSIACAGRGIGYIEPPLDKIHAIERFLDSNANNHG
jgi:hypothetical protein